MTTKIFTTPNFNKATSSEPGPWDLQHTYKTVKTGGKISKFAGRIGRVIYTHGHDTEYLYRGRKDSELVRRIDGVNCIVGIAELTNRYYWANMIGGGDFEGGL